MTEAAGQAKVLAAAARSESGGSGYVSVEDKLYL